jgi:hypothetical protein
MFHANTQRLIEDWRACRGARFAPDRADISPVEFREILPQLFILGREAPGVEAFRLAGGLLVDLHDRDLRGVSFLSLWPQPDRDMVAQAMDEAHRTGVPTVLEASAWTGEGYEVRLEIVLAPLVGPSGQVDRVLGLYQPTSSVRRLMGQPVLELTLREVKPAGQVAPSSPGERSPVRAERPRLRLATLDGERLG